MMKKPQEIINLEKLYGIKITEISITDNLYRNGNAFYCDENRTIIGLSLAGNKISKIQGLDELKNLTELDLSYNKINEIQGLDELTNLTRLFLYSNQINKIQGLEGLTNLTELSLYNNEISEIQGLDELKNLTELDLSDNQISEIQGLDELKNLTELDLSNNEISEIQGLDELKNLTYLKLYSNEINEIQGLDELKNLTYLHLDNNEISEIQGLDELTNLTELYINNNPFVEIMELHLKAGENHLNSIKNEIKKLKITKKQPIALPCKVMLLGNHASGKSSFLHYFVNNTPKNPKEAKSTDILSIYHYSEEKKEELPEAIFFDFGGQDYYHGVYQAFFTEKSCNILFWNTTTDVNRPEKDSNKLLTTHFNRNYWLGQIKYKLELVNPTNKEEKILLVQTHADDNKQTGTSINQREDSDFIQQEFYVSLREDLLEKEENSRNKFSEEEKKKYQLSLDYLVQYIKCEIYKREKVEKTPNEIALYQHIYQHTSADALPIHEIEGIYAFGIEALRGELKLLARKGMVLYYDNDKLRDVVWMNPAATVEKIHKDILGNKAKGQMPIAEFKKICTDDNLFELLVNEKVIFHDKPHKDGDPDMIIIPGYLPLAKEDDSLFWIEQTYQKHTMVLKFKSFIPFGLINQLICHYGKNPEKKKYYRDFLLFTHKELNASVLIQLVFEHLEMNISITPQANSESNCIEQARKIILDDILYMYWGETPPEYATNPKEEKEIRKERQKMPENLSISSSFETSREQKERKREKIPEDLYISLDNEYFVSLKQLEDEKENLKEILFYTKEKDNHLSEKGQSGNVFQFKHLTNNKNLSSSKKIFISYSKEDKDYLKELEQHLRDFETKLEIYYDELTDLGENVHLTILERINDCDYVIALVSHNFLNTDYIRKVEIPEMRKNQKKIIPIIVRPCSWEKVFEDYALQKGDCVSMKNAIDETSYNERQQKWKNIVTELDIKMKG